jgi:hypothetical protein
MSHIDPAFLQLCQMGYMCGLDKIAKGLGLGGKTEGMSGALAPVMWAKGREEQDKVLEYVAQDARTTAEMYEGLLEKGSVHWITQSGRLSRYPFAPKTKDGRLLTVDEATGLKLPDTSWMTDPRTRHSCYGWTAAVIKADPGLHLEEGIAVVQTELPF